MNMKSRWYRFLSLFHRRLKYASQDVDAMMFNADPANLGAAKKNRVLRNGRVLQAGARPDYHQHYAVFNTMYEAYTHVLAATGKALGIFILYIPLMIYIVQLVTMTDNNNWLGAFELWTLPFVAAAVVLWLDPWGWRNKEFIKPPTG